MTTEREADLERELAAWKKAHDVLKDALDERFVKAGYDKLATRYAFLLECAQVADEQVDRSQEMLDRVTREALVGLLHRHVASNLAAAQDYECYCTESLRDTDLTSAYVEHLAEAIERYIRDAEGERND